MLGIVLAPYGKVPGSFPYAIGYSYGGDGTFLCPHDPYQNQRGEPGFYSDTQLGGAKPLGFFQRIAAAVSPKYRARYQMHGARLGSSIPSDMDLTDIYGYTPHMTGFINSVQGDVQTPWNPPNGWRPAPTQLGCGNCNNLHDATLPPISTMPLPIDPISPDGGSAGSTSATRPSTWSRRYVAAQQLIDALNEHNQKMFTLSVVTTIAVAVSAVVAIARNARDLHR